MINNIVVFDMETNSVDPYTCSPVQLAAIMVNPRTLEIIPNSEFVSFVKPDTPNNMDTVQWHANLQTKKRKTKISAQDILNEWETYPSPKDVWPNFLSYLRKYHTKQDRQTKFTAPIPAGYNIIQFDLPIASRMHQMYGDEKCLFGVRDKIDMLDILLPWFFACPDINSRSMDVMRDWLGLSTADGHDALTDVVQTAQVLCRFLAFSREIAKSKQWFKGTFAA